MNVDNVEDIIGAVTVILVSIIVLTAFADAIPQNQYFNVELLISLFQLVLYTFVAVIIITVLRSAWE
jgi:hypothetical protein